MKKVSQITLSVLSLTFLFAFLCLSLVYCYTETSDCQTLIGQRIHLWARQINDVFRPESQKFQIDQQLELDLAGIESIQINIAAKEVDVLPATESGTAGIQIEGFYLATKQVKFTVNRLGKTLIVESVQPSQVDFDNLSLVLKIPSTYEGKIIQSVAGQKRDLLSP